MSLSLDEVRKVARLARLELSEPDLAEMQQPLSAILDYVDQLQKLDTDGVEPLAHPLPVQNVFRDDVPVPSLPVDDALKNAPNRTGDYFGELALIDGRPRPATVVATNHVHVMKLPSPSVLKLARQHPAITLTLLANLTTRLRRLEAEGAHAA